jgi:hypothetical protein
LLPSRSKLQEDRLIKIYIGDDSKPFHVQKAALITLSEYFTRPLKHENSVGGERGVLRFPEDDQTSWQILLHYAIADYLVDLDSPDDKQAAMLQWIKCWILGDKYNIKDFQDNAMLELLYMLDTEHIDLEVIKYAFNNTPPNSPLRKLMAREAVLTFYKPSGNPNPQDFEVFDGVSGFVVELMEAFAYKDSKRHGSGVRKTKLNKPEQRRKYIIGDGPQKHWIYDYCDGREGKHEE